MKSLLGFITGFGLVLGVGCAMSQPTPLYLADDFTARQINEVVLLEIAFLDPPLDSLLQDKAIEEIADQAVPELQAKGYQVLAVVENPPAPVWRRDAVDEETLRTAALKHQGRADAVVHIQVDHFLWGGHGMVEHEENGGGGGSDGLDIYATARLLSTATGEELWKAKGMGQSMITARAAGLFGPELYEPVRSLVRSLFATLPPAAR